MAARLGPGTAGDRTGALNKSCTALAPTLGMGDRLTEENVLFSPSAFWTALLGVEKLVRQITPDLRGLRHLLGLIENF
jgi:hypothetical protein